MSPSSLVRVAAAVALGLAAGHAEAESLWVGGGSFAGQTEVGYLGRVGPLPGGRLSDGWSHSIFIDQVNYEYDAGAERIHGNARSLKFAIGRQFQRSSGVLGLSLGVAARKTSLRPDDPGNRNRGSSIRPVAELQWQSHSDAPWRSQGIAQYVPGARSHFANLFVGRQLGRIALGPRLSTGGDPSYRIHGIGLAAHGWQVGNLTFSLHGGAQHAEGGGTRAEVGIGFALLRSD
jgi:hypothetical protein